MGRDDGSRKLADIVTLLFTDLVGSTEMLGRIGDDAAEEARLAHFGLLRDAIAAGGGHEVKNLGDGLMVVFGSALDALGCAVSIQLAARDHNRLGVGPPFHIRIGLHAGEPVREGSDFFGTPVVVASRLCAAARGGQILASLVLVGLIGTRGRFAIHPVGSLELKGLADPVPAAEVGWDQEGARTARPRPVAGGAGAGGRHPAGRDPPLDAGPATQRIRGPRRRGRRPGRPAGARPPGDRHRPGRGREDAAHRACGRRRRRAVSGRCLLL